MDFELDDLERVFKEHAELTEKLAASEAKCARLEEMCLSLSRARDVAVQQHWDEIDDLIRERATRAEAERERDTLRAAVEERDRAIVWAVNNSADAFVDRVGFETPRLCWCLDGEAGSSDIVIEGDTDADLIRVVIDASSNTIKFNREQAERFVDALENPPAPNEKLIKASKGEK